MTGVMTDLAPVEARLWAILASYRDRLVPGSVYGVSTVTRPGAKAHAYFAGVSVAVDEPVFADLKDACGALVRGVHRCRAGSDRRRISAG